MAADLPKWLKGVPRGLGLGTLAEAQTQDLEEAVVPEMPLEIDTAAPEAPAKRGRAKAEPKAETEVLPSYILRAEADLLKRLRGVRSVTVRVFGEDLSDGAALVRHLSRHGFDAKLSDIRNFAPAPSTVFTYHYQGSTATVTLAPSFVS